MITEFATALTMFRGALGLVKDVKDVLPEGKKEAVGAAIENAERTMKVAEAQAASALGYPICKCEWPPNIALASGGGNFRCPKCGKDPTDDYCAYVVG